MSPGMAVLAIIGGYLVVAWGIAFLMGITGDNDEEMVYWCAVLWPMYIVATSLCHLGEFFAWLGTKSPCMKKLWNRFILLFLPCRLGCKIREWRQQKNGTAA